MTLLRTTTVDFNPFTERRITMGEIGHPVETRLDAGPRCPVYFDGKLAGWAEPQDNGAGLLLFDTDPSVVNELNDYLACLTPMKFSFMTLGVTLEMIMIALMQARGFKQSIKDNCKHAVCTSSPNEPFGSYNTVRCSAGDVDNVIALVNRKFGAGNWLMLGNPRDGECIPPAYYTQSTWTGTVK
mgnify:CR=1 FL=1